MYYPIIDKLKTLVSDVQDSKPLIISGTITDYNNYTGTWEGNPEDIANAINEGKVVILKIGVTGAAYGAAILQFAALFGADWYINGIININGTIRNVVLKPDNTYDLI